MPEPIEYHDTYSGALDRARCAECAAWPAFPCALHADRAEGGGRG